MFTIRSWQNLIFTIGWWLKVISIIDFQDYPWLQMLTKIGLHGWMTNKNNPCHSMAIGKTSSTLDGNKKSPPLVLDDKWKSSPQSIIIMWYWTLISIVGWQLNTVSTVGWWLKFIPTIGWWPKIIFNHLMVTKFDLHHWMVTNNHPDH